MPSAAEVDAVLAAAEATKAKFVDIVSSLDRLTQELSKLKSSHSSELQASRRDRDEDVLVLHRSLASLDDLVNQTSAKLLQRWRDDLGPNRQLVERKPSVQRKWPLDLEEYRRYGRQLITPEIGLQGQLRLKKASVLVVGVGGLGCPAATYLAGAGVGKIGLMDGDCVELSNLHRQVAHSTSRIGQSKVSSAMQYLKDLNPLPKYTAHEYHLTPVNAIETFSDYDLILDCTDHPTSRYLISDAAVLLQKPLVSASALRTDGQLTVLNNPPTPAGDSNGGPCYRCVFPTPPHAQSVVSCGEGGILGPVVGVMGVLQALEAIKLLASGVGEPGTTARDNPEKSTSTPSLLIFSAFGSQQFRSVKLRPRRKACMACSSEAGITRESLTSGSLDYIQFCGVAQPAHLLQPSERMSVKDFENVGPSKHILIDVREKVQFDLCSRDGSINVPFSELMSLKPGKVIGVLSPLKQSSDPIYCICRLGNDSQVAVKKFQELGFDENRTRKIVDITGGWKAWKEQVDPEWPEY